MRTEMVNTKIYPAIPGQYGAFNLDGWHGNSWFVPVFLPNPGDFDQLVIGPLVITGATGGAHNAKLALYTDVDGRPGVRVGTEQVVNMSNDGGFAGDSFPAPDDAGWYWIGMITEAPIGTAAVIQGAVGNVAAVLESTFLIGYNNQGAVAGNKTSVAVNANVNYEEGFPATLIGETFFIVQSDSATDEQAPMLYVQPIAA